MISRPSWSFFCYASFGFQIWIYKRWVFEGRNFVKCKFMLITLFIMNDIFDFCELWWLVVAGVGANQYIFIAVLCTTQIITPFITAGHSNLEYVFWRLRHDRYGRWKGHWPCPLFGNKNNNTNVQYEAMCPPFHRFKQSNKRTFKLSILKDSRDLGRQNGFCV